MGPKCFKPPALSQHNFLLTILIHNQRKRLQEWTKLSPTGKCLDLETFSLDLFCKEMYGEQSWGLVGRAPFWRAVSGNLSPQRLTRAFEASTADQHLDLGNHSFDRTQWRQAVNQGVAEKAEDNVGKEENAEETPPTTSAQIAEETATPALNTAATGDAVESTLTRAKIHIFLRRTDAY